MRGVHVPTGGGHQQRFNRTSVDASMHLDLPFV